MAMGPRLPVNLGISFNCDYHQALVNKSVTKVVLKLACHVIFIIFGRSINFVIQYTFRKKVGTFFCSELNPVSWSNFQNLRGFTMFSKEIQIEEVTMYLQGIPHYKKRKKFGIKGTDTIQNGVTIIDEISIYGLINASQSKIMYPYSFKINVIKWRHEHRAS